ncbi:hypothetical protein LguiB_012629 [Lonicera macranthoides]
MEINGLSRGQYRSLKDVSRLCSKCACSSLGCRVVPGIKQAHQFPSVSNFFAQLKFGILTRFIDFARKLE